MHLQTRYNVFTCEENHIGFSRHLISLVPVNTNSALPWKIFLNVKTRIKDTKKIFKREWKKTKYQEPKEHNSSLFYLKTLHERGRDYF